MHASSYIRYLGMSKSCKIDTNSYSETGSLCSSDASQEFNLAPNVHRALLIAVPLIKPVWCTETQVLESSDRLHLQTVRHFGVLIPPQKWQAALGHGRWRARRPALVQFEEKRLAGWQTGLHQDTTLEQVAPFSLMPSWNAGHLPAIQLPPPDIKPSIPRLWGEANGFDFGINLPCLERCDICSLGTGSSCF